jgi:hypothetical protein
MQPHKLKNGHQLTQTEPDKHNHGHETTSRQSSTAWRPIIFHIFTILLQTAPNDSQFPPLHCPSEFTHTPSNLNQCFSDRALDQCQPTQCMLIERKARNYTQTTMTRSKAHDDDDS